MTLTLENKLMMDNLIMYSEELMEEPEVPFGSLDQEVADDVPVMLSEGEYVIPADVVRYWGLKHLEEMRNMAKCGLMSMEMDGRLHKVDDDGLLPAEEEKEEDAEVATEDAIEIVSMDFDIDEMQEDMEEEEEEDDVDFDGDKDRMIHAYNGASIGGAGGEAGQEIELDRQNNYDYRNVSIVDLALTDIDIMTAMAQVGLTDLPTDRDPTAKEAKDAVNSLADVTDKERKGVANQIAREAYNNATDDIPGLPGKAVDVVTGLLGMAAPTPVGGFLGIANTKSEDKTFSKTDLRGNTTAMTFNFGGSAALNAAAVANLSTQVDVGLQKKSGTLTDPYSLVSIGNNTVASVVGGVVRGAVPPQYDLTDLNKAIGATLGVDIRPADVNPVTGLVDFTTAEPLAGVQTDPTTGYSTTGGYSLSRGDFTDANGNVSALGTIGSMNNLNEREFGIVDRAKGTGFLGFTDEDRDRRNAEFFGNRDVQAQAQFDKDEMNKELSRIGVDLTDYTSPTNDETLDATLDDLTDIMSIEDLNPDTTFDDLDATLEPPADYSFPEPTPPDYLDATLEPPFSPEPATAPTTTKSDKDVPPDLIGLMSMDFQDMLGAIGVDDPSAEAQAGVDGDVDPGVESDEESDEESDQGQGGNA